MKKIFIALLTLATCKNVYSQNVGIGTSSPKARLEIVTTQTSNSSSILMARNDLGDTLIRLGGDGRLNLKYNGPSGARTLNIGGSGINFYTSEQDFGGAIFPTDTSLVILSNSNANNHIVIQPSNLGNVGIGTYGPQYKLDVKGRMRVRTTTATAGIWFDGVTNPVRSFIGTLNEDYMGIFGNGGIGWGFVMNVNSGNVGIGVTTPTSALDVNGNLRIRGSSPKKGSLLTSMDVNGNAEWKEAIAFKATGGYNGAPTIIPQTTFTKVFFHQTISYNAGLGFQPVNSQFVVPEKGIYHFDVQLHWEKRMIEKSVRIVVNRGGGLFAAAENFEDRGADNDNDLTFNNGPSAVSSDLSLEAGDIVWIEAYHYTESQASNSISPVSFYTWFSGHLVTRL